MNAEGHKKKAEEIKASLNRLLPDPEGKNVVAIVKLTYGILLYLIAFGMESKYGKHLDTYVSLPRELRKLEENEVAIIFETLDTFRAGRWYGSRGNKEVNYVTVMRKNPNLQKKNVAMVTSWFKYIETVK